jgi:hypothetical protein
MWQKVAKFKGAEYFRKALYILDFKHLSATVVVEIAKSTNLKGCPYAFVNIDYDIVAARSIECKGRQRAFDLL